MSLAIESSNRWQQTIRGQPTDENVPDVNSPTSRPSEISTQCSVSGALALVLRLSRIAGIAPLDFKQQGTDTWIIRVSKAWHVYGVVLNSVLNILLISAVARDASVEHARSIRMRSLAKSTIWTAGLVVAMLVTNNSVCTAPATMKAMVSFHGRIQKLNSDNKPQVENGLKYIVVFVASFSAAVYCFDYYEVLVYALDNDRDVAAACLYGSCYWLYLNQTFIYLQFSMSVLNIYFAIKGFNDRLEYIIKSEGNQNTKDNEVPLKSINIVIDRITSGVDNLPPRKKTVHETIRSLEVSYSDVCAVMDEMNKCFGVTSAMLVLNLLVNLVVASYYVSAAIFMKGNVYRTVLMQSVWATKHLVSMLLTVEPCHWTYQEMLRTRLLMVQLTCRTVTAIGPVAVELRRFFWCINLNNILHSPLGTCMLTRLTYVSILGATITYFVMGMQFTTEDDGNDR